MDNKLILVVDDTPANLDLIDNILTKQGYRVAAVPDGQRALKWVLKKTPDLVLLDINMPGIDGYAVCEALKKQPKTRDVPVIFISALGETMDKVKAFSVGGVDYITKPFQTEEMLVRIETHLALRLMQRQLQESNTQLAQEIVDRKQAEQAAQAANQAKSVFLASMSHELRTPLNAILGFAQMMQRSGALSSEHQEFMNIIIRSGEYLLSLINDVLDMSKIEAGKMTLQAQTLDLERLLADVNDMFSFSAQKKGLEFSFVRPDTLCRTISTDGRKLRQVLINLIGNAMKFTRRGGIVLTVAQTLTDDEAVTLHFQVKDTGPGIPADEIENLFEAFTQTATGRALQEGTGLGLPISRKFVQMLGGDISVRSAPGEGATFAFSIQAKRMEDAPIEPTQQRIVGLAPGQPRYRILIVDDKTENRQLLFKLLNPFGFELREAVNGQEAVALCQRWVPQLIWMDLHMPVMDGLQATQLIKAMPEGKEIKIVALTASILTADKQVVFVAGCDDFLSKPYKDHEIFNLMRRLIDVRYLYAEPQEPAPQTAQAEPSIAAMQQLPAPLLKQMLDALDYGEFEPMEALFEQVGEQDTVLAETLREMAKSYCYDRLEACIKQAQE